MSYPPEGVVCDDPALARMRRRYVDIQGDVTRLQAEAQRLQREIDDRQQTLRSALGHATGALVEFELVRAWLRTADPEFPATP